MEEFDYYAWRSREQQDDYDPEEAPYESLAPDLAGESPLASWQATEARPSGNKQDDSGMRLREGSIAGAAPVPTSEEAAGVQPQSYTTPTYWGKENINQVNEVMGGQPLPAEAAPARQESYTAKTIRVMQQYAAGVYEKAADVFGRSRGQ